MFEELTGRERCILKFVASGHSSSEIGKKLRISYRTVEWHISRAIEKLGAKNRTHAVVIALRHGLIKNHPVLLLLSAFLCI